MSHMEPMYFQYENIHGYMIILRVTERWKFANWKRYNQVNNYKVDDLLIDKEQVDMLEKDYINRGYIEGEYGYSLNVTPDDVIKEIKRKAKEKEDNKNTVDGDVLVEYFKYVMDGRRRF